mgnify:CR=1 FL=1
MHGGGSIGGGSIGVASISQPPGAASSAADIADGAAVVLPGDAAELEPGAQVGPENYENLVNSFTYLPLINFL